MQGGWVWKPIIGGLWFRCNRDEPELCPEFSDAADHIATIMANKIGAWPFSAYREHAEAVLPLLVRTYNQGYVAGHNETIDGQYIDIHQSDKWEYHDEYVREFIVDVLAERPR